MAMNSTKNAEGSSVPVAHPHRLPFAALTLAKATKLAKGVPGAQHGYRMQGDWQHRRFVIDGLTLAPDVVLRPVANMDSLTLDLPLNLRAAEYINECRRFGMSVESAFRRNRYFETAGDIDGVMHIVHSFHHVAVCGFKGPWSDCSHYTPPTCQTCLLESEILPQYRARYHTAIEK